jgi:hypothetical protein
MTRLIITLKNGTQLYEAYADRQTAVNALRLLTHEVETGKSEFVITAGGGSTFRVTEFSSATLVDRQ